jgi:hypothetical protein
MPDWLGQANVAATGLAVVTINQNNASTVWEIEQISVSVGPISTGANVAIFKNGNLVAPTSSLVPQVNSAGISSIGQTAAGLPYVYVNASDHLDIVVNSATIGDLMSVRAQYREFPKDDPAMSGR